MNRGRIWWCKIWIACRRRCCWSVRTKRIEEDAFDTMLLKMLVVAGEGAIQSTCVWACSADGEDDVGLLSKVVVGQSLLDGPPVTPAGHD
ncbi:hypothetical protein ACLOJK_024068 [Asimina triloba]